MSIVEGVKYVKKKINQDYNKLSPRTKELLKDKYENIIKVLFK